MVHIGARVIRSYIIDTPNHKQWWCPDNRHIIDLCFYRISVSCSVMTADYFTKQSFRVEKSNREWEYLVEQFCLLAEKRYPKQVRNKINDNVERQRRGW